MNNNELNVLWTNADPLTAEHMVLLYTINAQKRGWFEQVNIIVWGATAKLVAEDEKIQNLVKEAISVGVKFRACIHCATELNVGDELIEIGIPLEPMGLPLTDLIKNDAKILTI